jgi:hypothetical protein
VLDEAGEPVVGVYVTLLPRIPIAGEHQYVAGPVTRTDDRGVYRVGPLTPGSYVVMVPSVQHAVPAAIDLPDLAGARPAARLRADGTPPLDRARVVNPADPAVHLIVEPGAPPLVPRAEGRPQAYPITFHPSARSLATAAAVDLAAGEERAGVDVQLRPSIVSRLSGRVEGPPDAVANLVLRLMPAGSENLTNGHEAATAVVGADGRFTMLNVPDGDYVLLANRFVAGYTYSASSGSLGDRLPPPPVPLGITGESASAVFSAPTGTMFWLFSQGGPTAFSGRTAVNVAGADRTDVVVRLRRGVSLTGRFVVEAAPGLSTRPSLEARAEPAGGEAMLGAPRGRVNPQDPSLAFTIDGLLPGEYLLRTFGGGGWIKSVTWGDKDITQVPLVVEDQDITGVVITTTSQPARVEGVVRDAQGRPASDVVVMHFPVESSQWRRYGVQPPRLRAVPVTSAGAFSLNLPAGDYYVLAVNDDLSEAWKDPTFLQSAAGLATRVTASWATAATVNLTVATPPRR